MRLSKGSKVYHPKYGSGVVIEAWLGKKRAQNYAVKFENGGPQGWAQRSTHEADELERIQ